MSGGYHSGNLRDHDYCLWYDRYKLHTTEPTRLSGQRIYQEDGMLFTYIYKQNNAVDIKLICVRLPDKSQVIFEDEKRFYEFMRFHTYLKNENSNYLNNYLNNMSRSYNEMLDSYNSGID
jgi:hypothetical protein